MAGGGLLGVETPKCGGVKKLQPKFKFLVYEASESMRRCKQIYSEIDVSCTFFDPSKTILSMKSFILPLPPAHFPPSHPQKCCLHVWQADSSLAVSVSPNQQ